MKTLKNLGILILVLLCCGVGYAAVPHLINYQGRLTDSQGKPLEGLQSLTFRIYDAASGGAPLWEETQSVNLEKGIFNVLLGANETLGPAFDKPYYLEIKVGDEVMSPRQEITSAGYAIMAENTLSIPRGVIVMWSGTTTDIPFGWALCDGKNGTPDLRDRFVVGAGNSYAVGATGGETAHTLTTSELPSHSHTLDGHTNDSSAGHEDHMSRVMKTGGDAGAISTSSTGGGQVHENRPPYYALAYIMKL